MIFIQGFQSGAFYLNYKPDFKSINIKVLTHEEVRENAGKAAAAATLVADPTSEPEDVAPATFETESPAVAEQAVSDAPVEEQTATEASTEVAPVDASQEPTGATAESSGNESQGEVESEAVVNDVAVEAAVPIESDAVIVQAVVESSPVAAETDK